MLSRGLVLYPLEALIVFPCIGSHDQTTFLPSDLIFFKSFGRFSLILFVPYLVIKVNLPSSLFGLIISISLSSSSTSKEGPHFKPIGLLIPLTNSICAPSG